MGNLACAEEEEPRVVASWPGPYGEQPEVFEDHVGGHGQSDCGYDNGSLHVGWAYHDQANTKFPSTLPQPAWPPSPDSQARHWSPQPRRRPTATKSQTLQPEPAASAAYLRDILACDESLRAAFEPVLRAARCRFSDGVDRDAFALAVARISGYFAPHAPALVTAPVLDDCVLPYSPLEALEHFRVALYLLAQRLEELPVASSRAPSLLARALRPVSPVPALEVACAQGPQLPLPLPTPLPQWTLPRPASPAVVRASDRPEDEAIDGKLLAQLEASRSRVAGLRRALAREEELLQWQATEEQRLKRLLEAWQPQNQELHAAVAPQALRAGSAGKRRGGPTSVPSLLQPSLLQPPAAPGPLGEASALPMEGPMSLEDVKTHLGAVRRLRRRVKELEVALDTKEEQVAALNEAMRRTRADAAASTPATSITLSVRGTLGRTAPSQ